MDVWLTNELRDVALRCGCLHNLNNLLVEVCFSRHCCGLSAGCAGSGAGKVFMSDFPSPDVDFVEHRSAALSTPRVMEQFDQVFLDGL